MFYYQDITISKKDADNTFMDALGLIKEFSFFFAQ